MPQGSSRSPVARPRPLMPRPTAIASVSGRRPVVDVVLCCLLCGVCAEATGDGARRSVVSRRYIRPTDRTRGDGLYACLGNPRCDMSRTSQSSYRTEILSSGAARVRDVVQFLFRALPQSHKLMPSFFLLSTPST